MDQTSGKQQSSTKNQLKTKNKQNNWRTKYVAGYCNRTMLSLFLSLQLPTPTEKKASMANVKITSQNEIVSNQRRIRILLHVGTLLKIFFAALCKTKVRKANEATRPQIISIMRKNNRVVLQHAFKHISIQWSVKLPLKFFILYFLYQKPTPANLISGYSFPPCTTT